MAIQGLAVAVEASTDRYLWVRPSSSRRPAIAVKASSDLDQGVWRSRSGGLAISIKGSGGRAAPHPPGPDPLSPRGGGDSAQNVWIAACYAPGPKKNSG
jgi:hypothetical protein